MNVLFLDVDGVLNSMKWIKSDKAITNSGVWGMDIEAVKLLKYIVEKSKCKIVVSSSWRIGGITEGSHFYEELKRTDPSDKILDAVIGHTCTGWVDPPLKKDFVRGDQIQRWIEDNDFDGKFVILDDDSDMAHLMDHLVHTKLENGMTRSDVQKVLEKFNE